MAGRDVRPDLFDTGRRQLAVYEVREIRQHIATREPSDPAIQTTHPQTSGWPPPGANVRNATGSSWRPVRVAARGPSRRRRGPLDRAACPRRDPRDRAARARARHVRARRQCRHMFANWVARPCAQRERVERLGGFPRLGFPNAIPLLTPHNVSPAFLHEAEPVAGLGSAPSAGGALRRRPPPPGSDTTLTTRIRTTCATGTADDSVDVHLRSGVLRGLFTRRQR